MPKNHHHPHHHHHRSDKAAAAAAAATNKINLLTHSPGRSMPPEVMSVDESDTLLEENETIGEIISERRRIAATTTETGRRLINPAVTIVEMSGIKASTSAQSDKPLLTPSSTTGDAKSPFTENNTANSTGLYD